MRKAVLFNLIVQVVLFPAGACTFIRRFPKETFRFELKLVKYSRAKNEPNHLQNNNKLEFLRKLYLNLTSNESHHEQQKDT